MSSAKKLAAERQEAAARIREHVKPGDTVYCILRHVSRSGMSRVIDLKVIDKDGSVWHIGYNAALATGLPYDRKSEGVKIGGCGMDMGFALVSSLGHALWPEGYECLGDKCPDPSHVNYRQTCKNCGHTAYWHREARREDADDSHADSSCAYGGCTCQEYIPGDPDPRGPGVHHKESDYALKHSWL